MDLMTIANKVEEELQKKKMAGSRIGSGFYFPTNTRDVQLDYGEIKDTEIITNTIKDIVNSFEGEFDVNVRYKEEDFTFYISPKE